METGVGFGGAVQGPGLRPTSGVGVVTVFLPSPPAAEPCPEPTIVPSYYTTSDAVISTESVFVVEISLACKNGAQVGGCFGRGGGGGGG